MERSCFFPRACRRLLRRVIPGRLAALAALPCVLAAPAAAQEGGVVARFCTDGPACVDDALEIVFESGGSTYEGPFEPGVEVPIEVVIDTRSPDIQGYSWAVKHDGDVLSLIPGSLSIAGTIIDPESPDTAIRGEAWMVHRVVAGGFFAAVVLSIRESTALPLGRNVVCRAAYEMTGAPDCTVIHFVDGQLGMPASPAVAINITAAGRPTYPGVLRQGLIRTGDCPETCDDLADNDGDGLADCGDPDCSADFRCTGEEACDDGIDNNADGRIDCRDPRCRGVLDCPNAEACMDGADNDGDGLADCDDPDCWALSICRGGEACDDGTDNDRDGLTDCRDPDCRGDVACQERCDDGIDNDLDSLIDCRDRDCSGIGGCPEFEVCGDGRDNDEDGLADCDDPECRSKNPCVEVCSDGIDNDADGFVDGLDLDCNHDHRSASGAPLVDPPPPALIRGDADGSRRLTVLDAIVVVRVAVNGEEPPFDCFAALETNGDDGVNIADALPILRWIFLDGPPLPGPFPGCGLHDGCRESSPGCG